jgi:hypothetical protein
MKARVLSFVGAQLGTDTFVLGALVCLTIAETPNYWGGYTDDGFKLMLLTIVLLFVAVFAPRGNTSPLIWALMVGTFGLATRAYIGDAAWLVAGFAAAAVLAAPRRWAWMLIAAAGASSLLPLARDWTWGTAVIDVFRVVQGGATALLHGQNPYGPTFAVGVYPDYTYTTAPMHFMYGPAMPLLAAPGALVGDVRVMSVAMFIALFGGIIGLAATHPDKRRQWWLIAICVAFPLTITMVLNAWIDVYPVALFVAWTVLRRRHSFLASLALGVSFAVKVTIIPALIPFWLWSSKVRRESAIAVLVAAVIALPFAIATGIDEFVQDTIMIFVDSPTRFEFLTANSYLWQHGQDPLDGWVGVVVVVVVGCLILWRKPHDIGDSFVRSALLLTIMFFLSKQAPLNYYFIPITLLVLALATRGLPLDAPENIHLPHLNATSWRRYFSRSPVGAGTSTFVPETVSTRLVSSRRDRSPVEVARSTVEVAPSRATEGTETGSPLTSMTLPPTNGSSGPERDLPAPSRGRVGVGARTRTTNTEGDGDVPVERRRSSAFEEGSEASTTGTVTATKTS